MRRTAPCASGGDSLSRLRSWAAADIRRVKAPFKLALGTQLAGAPTSLAILVFLLAYLITLWARRTHAGLRWLYLFVVFTGQRRKLRRPANTPAR